MHPTLDTITTEPDDVVAGLAALATPRRWEPTPQAAARAFHVLAEVARGATRHGKPARILAARKMHELASSPLAESVDAILSEDTTPSDGPFRFEDVTVEVDGQALGDVVRGIKWTPPMLDTLELRLDRAAMRGIIEEGDR